MPAGTGERVQGTKLQEGGKLLFGNERLAGPGDFGGLNFSGGRRFNQIPLHTPVQPGFDSLTASADGSGLELPLLHSREMIENVA